ncbi:MAG: hypothetical protein ABI315_09975 [Bacteroidia bacterium]
MNYHKTLFFAASVMLANTVNLNAQSTITGNSYAANRFLGWGTTSGNLEFRVNNTVKMFMENTTGNVGIGTGTSALPQKLTVVGGAIGWGYTATSNIIGVDQGGNIELGGTNSIKNPVTGGIPYIDFHFGTGTVQDFNMRIINNGNNRLDFAQSGNLTAMTINNLNVGIGTVAPIQQLDVNGRMNISNGVIQRGGAAITSTSDLGLYSLIAGQYMRFVTNSGPIKFFGDGGTDPLGVNQIASFESNGKVVIGRVPYNTASDYRLFVQTGIITEKVKVAVATSSDWSDYVFAHDYKLKTIEELEAFVKEHKHLPNVPSAEEVVKEGVDMAKMDAKLLEKIEELTLYVIQQQKEIELLKSKK